MPLMPCQLDAYTTQMHTEIIAVDGCRVRTADSVLYPGGGGQPADAGTLNGVPIVEVFGHCDYALATPQPVGPAHIAIDWGRRFDHMQQHTAQHLITALAEQLLDAPTLAFHLNPERCDVVLDTPQLSPAQMAQLADAVHARIRAALPVQARLIDPADLDGVRSRRLPPGHEGPLRVVEIDGIDQNTCGGTHVANLTELQVVHFLGAEKSNQGLRLHWLAGERALRWMRAAHDRTLGLTRVLKTGPVDHLAACERLVAQNREAARQLRTARSELATALGQALPAGATWFHRDDADMGFLNAVAKAAADRPRLLLTGGTRGDGVFLLVGQDVPADLGPKIAAVLAGRGGGRGRYQGKAAAIEHRARAAELLA
jgi:Ser-tRNA(Ala) deacylase AlaX